MQQLYNRVDKKVLKEIFSVSPNYSKSSLIKSTLDISF